MAYQAVKSGGVTHASAPPSQSRHKVWCKVLCYVKQRGSDEDASLEVLLCPFVVRHATREERNYLCRRSGHFGFFMSPFTVSLLFLQTFFTPRSQM